MTRELSAAWVREAILVVDGAAPSRHFWSRWMDRALAPHRGEMAAPHTPIAANDIEAADGEDPLPKHTRDVRHPVLRFD